jgi:hypothetical protein
MVRFQQKESDIKLRRMFPNFDEADEPGASLRQNAFVFDFAWPGEAEHESIQRRWVVKHVKFLAKTGQNFMLIMSAVMNLGFGDPTDTWIRLSNGMTEGEIRAMIVHPDGATVLTAAERTVYLSTDSGQHFKSVWQLPGSQSRIQDFQIDGINSDDIYAAYDSGIAVSHDRGERWQEIYRGGSVEEDRCLSVSAGEDIIFAGTASGLLVKEFGESNWKKLSGELAHRPVYKLAYAQAYIFAATANEVYRIDPESLISEKIYEAGSQESEFEIFSLLEDESALNENRVVRDMIVLGPRHELLVLAVDKNILISRDDGKQWEKWDLHGTIPDDINSVWVKNSIPSHGQAPGESYDSFSGGFALWAATNHGVLRNDGNGWETVYKGLDSTRIFEIHGDPAGRTYAATDRGLYMLSERPAQNLNFPQFTGSDYSQLAKAFADEPTIQQVHEWAIESADVHPDKIKKWRKQARARAFVPSLSVGVDRDSGELFHWDTGPNPDQFAKGRETVGWDASLSWDLADFVWSSDQTSIDSRSKLTVELRGDVLDQVTRLYFERRRLQMELLASASSHPGESIEMQLRIEELTALIDGMTGGQFSQWRKPMSGSRRSPAMNNI